MLNGRIAFTNPRTFVAIGGGVLGFALQDAARAAHVLALLTSSRFLSPLARPFGERRISRRGFAQSMQVGQALRRKGKTNP